MTLNLATAKFSVCIVSFAMHNYHIKSFPEESAHLHSLYAMQETTSISLSGYDDVFWQLSLGFVAVMRKGSILQWQIIVS